MKNPYWLIGKTIATVEMRPFRSSSNRRTARTAHDPIITFTDGTSIKFVVEETELGYYGVDIVLSSQGRERTNR